MTVHRTIKIAATIAAGTLLAVGLSLDGSPPAHADTVTSGDCSVTATDDSVTVRVGGRTAFSASANDSATDAAAQWSAALPTSQEWGVSMDPAGQATVWVDSSYGGPSSLDTTYTVTEPCTTTSLLGGITTTTLTAHATIHVTIGGTTGSPTPSPSASPSPTSTPSDPPSSAPTSGAPTTPPVARDDRVLLSPGQSVAIDLAANDDCAAGPCTISVPPSALDPCSGVPAPCEPSRSWTLTQTGPTTFQASLSAGFATGAPGDPRETSLAGVAYTLTDASGAQAFAHLDLDYMTTSAPTTSAPPRTGTMTLARPTATVVLHNSYAQGRSTRSARYFNTPGSGRTRATRWLAFAPTTFDVAALFGVTKSAGCILATADDSSHDGNLRNGIRLQSSHLTRSPRRPFVGTHSPIATAIRHDRTVHAPVRSLWGSPADFVHTLASGLGVRVNLGVTHNAPMRPGTYTYPIAMTCGDGRSNYRSDEIDPSKVVTGTLVVTIK